MRAAKKFKIPTQRKNRPSKIRTDFEKNTSKNCSAVLFFMSMTEIDEFTMTSQLGSFTLHEKIRLREAMNWVTTVSRMMHSVLMRNLYSDISSEPEIKVHLEDIFPAHLVEQEGFTECISDAIENVDRVLNNSNKIITFVDYRKPSMAACEEANGHDFKIFQKNHIKDHRLFHPKYEPDGCRKWVSPKGSGSGHCISIEEDIFTPIFRMDQRANKIYCKLNYSINISSYHVIIRDYSQYLFNRISFIMRKKIVEETKNNTIQMMNDQISQLEYDQAMNNPLWCSIL